MTSALKYVIVTPARNESAFIEQTIKSVVSQTVRPEKWVIISDGSTDGTDDIVNKYTQLHRWIELVRMPARRERHFAGKVHAFRAGYEKLHDVHYEVIASLDADVSFDSEYFSYLLEKLKTDSTLGLVGTPFKEDSNEIYDYRFVSIEHVSGACQVFRRKCFEEIEGYVPIRIGGVDHFMVISARFKGWKTRTFTGKVCHHHRSMGSAQAGRLKAKFKNGVKDYAFGNHPLWEIVRAAYQMTKKPLVIGGVLLGAGYCWALISQMERPISNELVSFQQRDQLQRLKKFFRIPRRRSAMA